MSRLHIRFRAVDKAGFENIRTGRKTVETRAATTRYRNIQPGDTLVISCDTERVEKVVRSVQHFGSIQEMLAEIDLQEIMPGVGSREEAEKIYTSFSGYEEKIRQYGILAMRFCD